MILHSRSIRSRNAVNQKANKPHIILTIPSTRLDTIFITLHPFSNYRYHYIPTNALLNNQHISYYQSFTRTTFKISDASIIFGSSTLIQLPSFLSLSFSSITNTIQFGSPIPNISTFRASNSTTSVI